MPLITDKDLSELAVRFYAAADAVGKALASFTPHQRLLILSNCIANEVNETLAQPTVRPTDACPECSRMDEIYGVSR